LAEIWQGAGRQFLGKCYLKSFQIAVPEFYKKMHHLIKADDEPLVFLNKITAVDLSGFEEHLTTPGQTGRLWKMLSCIEGRRMSVEQALNAYREYVSDPLAIWY
jgi:hypothetical protein